MIHVRLNGGSLQLACLYDIYLCHSLTVDNFIPSFSKLQIMDDYCYLLEM